MATPENPMAYLLELSLRRIERERPEIANDQKYAELKGQLLQDADGHFREIQATYATVLKTQCNCGGPLEPVDHDFGQCSSQVQVLRLNPELSVSQGGLHLGSKVSYGLEGLSAANLWRGLRGSSHE